MAQMLGLCAAAVCLTLCVLAVRPRNAVAGAFPMRAHELLGWLALAAVLLHVGWLLAGDHRVAEHLKLTAPRYEIAGIVALLALLFLAVPAGTAARSRFWSHHRSFQAAHVGAACLLIVAMAVHIVSTDRYVHGRAHRVAYALLSASVLLALLRARARRQPHTPGPGFMGGLAFGRYSRLVLGIVAGALIALFALTRPATTLTMREPVVQRSDRLPLEFPHDKHRAVNCVACHHNFVDHSGAESCVSCHRSGRSEILVGAEARFHDFCLSCHRDPPASLIGHGPVSGCSTCHGPATQASQNGATPRPAVEPALVER
jgi:Class III cytochrome C family